MDCSPKPPEALMRAIAQDLRPVRPSPQPLHLALRMVPLAVLASSLILLAIGPRHDLGMLGPLLTWGASALGVDHGLLGHRCPRRNSAEIIKPEVGAISTTTTSPDFTTC
jgi:hypothetical protein